MCYRYVLQLETLQALAEYLAVSRPFEWRSRYNLAPGEHIPVIRGRSAAKRWRSSRSAGVSCQLGPGTPTPPAHRPTRAPRVWRPVRLFAKLSASADASSRRAAFMNGKAAVGDGGPSCSGRMMASRSVSPACGRPGATPVADRTIETCTIITTAPNELMRPSTTACRPSSRWRTTCAGSIPASLNHAISPRCCGLFPLRR